MLSALYALDRVPGFAPAPGLVARLHGYIREEVASEVADEDEVTEARQGLVAA